MISTPGTPFPPEIDRPGSGRGPAERLGRDPCLTEKIKLFLSTRSDSPLLAMDLGVVGSKYAELREHFPSAAAYYAVKANPAREVVSLLAAEGASFDIASPAELDLCLSLGVTPEHLSYGHTIKKTADIAYAYGRGVCRFAFDSEAEVRKLAGSAPGAVVNFPPQAASIHAARPPAGEIRFDPDIATPLLRL